MVRVAVYWKVSVGCHYHLSTRSDQLDILLSWLSVQTLHIHLDAGQGGPDHLQVSCGVIHSLTVEKVLPFRREEHVKEREDKEEK